MKKVILLIAAVLMAACASAPNIYATPTAPAPTATPNIVTATPTQIPTATPTPTPTPTQTAIPTANGTYTVQAGETLGQIAAKSGCPTGTWRTLTTFPIQI